MVGFRLPFPKVGDPYFWAMANQSRAQGWRQKTESFRVPLVLWLRPRGLNLLLDTVSLLKGIWKEFWRPVSQPNDDALVLVVCANYNHADWLEGGVGSMMNQTFKRWRLMLVDDCSTDHSLDKLRALAHTDDRIQVIQLKENSGAYVARNTGVSASKDAWTHVTFFDPDDVAKEDWLAHVVGRLGSNSGVVRPILKRTDALLRGSKRLYYGYCGSLVSRDVWELLGGFVSRRVAGDTEFFLRVKRASALEDIHVRYSTRVSQLCRVHDGNASSQNLEERKRWLEHRAIELDGILTAEGLRVEPVRAEYNWVVE